MKNSRHYPVSFSKVSNSKDEIPIDIEKDKVSKTYEKNRQYYSNNTSKK